MFRKLTFAALAGVGLLGAVPATEAACVSLRVRGCVPRPVCHRPHCHYRAAYHRGYAPGYWNSGYAPGYWNGGYCR